MKHVYEILSLLGQLTERGEENDIFEGKTWMYITAVICGEGTLERIPSTDLRTLL